MAALATEVEVVSQPGSEEVVFQVALCDLSGNQLIVAPEIKSRWGEAVSAETHLGDYELVFHAKTTAARAGIYFVGLNRGGRAVLSHTVTLPESEPHR